MTKKEFEIESKKVKEAKILFYFEPITKYNDEVASTTDSMKIHKIEKGGYYDRMNKIIRQSETSINLDISIDKNKK